MLSGVLLGMIPLTISAETVTDAVSPALVNSDANTKETKGLLNKVVSKIDTRLSEHLNISGLFSGERNIAVVLIILADSISVCFA